MSFLVKLNIDLPPSKDAITDYTNAFVVERIPLSFRVGCFQDFKALFWRKVSLHYSLAARPLGLGKAGASFVLLRWKRKRCG